MSHLCTTISKIRCTIRYTIRYTIRHKSTQSECTKVHKSAQKCTKVHKSAQKCTKVHKSAQKCTKVHKFLVHKCAQTGTQKGAQIFNLCTRNFFKFPKFFSIFFQYFFFRFLKPAPLSNSQSRQIPNLRHLYPPDAP